MAKKVIKTIKQPAESGGKTCCEHKWNLLPLRFALGLMFLAAGLPKLFSLISGNSQIPGFFASLGIPLAGFSAWLVAIVEVIGGIFLLIGFLTWWTGLILGIVLVVATLTTTLSPLSWGKLTQHLVFITALIAVMHGNRYMSVGCFCKCKHK
jgi:uncharacterized membrane protein YphA (DoxX/SURF4 family)